MTLQFVKRLQSIDSPNEFIPDLIDTVNRQTVEMLKKKKYVEKWGDHPLRHLIRSLFMQCKGNFREQCLKDFGGNMFNDLADTADDIYNSMDPPTPSLLNQAKPAAQIQNAVQFQQAMNNFDDDDVGGYYGGCCFHGKCKVQMQNGITKFIRDLKKGDKIATPANSTGATITCVVKTKTWQGKTRMCELNGDLMVTPGHPIKQQSKEWILPKTLVQPKLVACDHFYNLVVDQGHIAKVNGVEAILLVHNYTEGILKHEYFGSQRVIQDLKKVPGFDQGLVELHLGDDGLIQEFTKNLTLIDEKRLQKKCGEVKY